MYQDFEQTFMHILLIKNYLWHTHVNLLIHCIKENERIYRCTYDMVKKKKNMRNINFRNTKTVD